MLRALKEGCFDVLYRSGSVFFGAGKVPILTYHSIGNSDSAISVSRSMFMEQMTLLLEAGFSTIALDEYINTISRNQLPEGKRFVITVDDGYKNNHAVLLPILVEYGLCATVFLATGYVGKRCNWIEDGAIPRIEMMSWSDAAEMASHGVAFGAHSVTHPRMTELAEDEIAKEVATSKDVIEQKLGKPVRGFCYPYGDYDHRVIRAVKESGFACACSGDRGVHNDATTLYTLRRLQVQSDTSLGYFKFFFSGLYDWNARRKRYFRALVRRNAPR